MKHFVFFFFAVIGFCSDVKAQGNAVTLPNLSPSAKVYLDDMRHGRTPASEMYVYKQLQDGHKYISALIKVADAPLAANNLQGIGAVIGTKAGNIWTVNVPVSQVVTFTTLSGIEYIQLDEPVFPQLYQARKTTRVDSVHKGYNLPMPYSGENVLMGIMDFGFDYNHPAFYDTTGTRYRIKKVWEMNGTGNPPAGYAYGTEVIDTFNIKARGTDNALQIHGTGVAGIAAGSGYGSCLTSDRFRGMAYASDFVLVGVRRDSIGNEWMSSGFSDFLDGVNYMFNYATSVSKPIVANISWGSQSGPHDGTSLFNQACNSITGVGKILVMSAGNEGTEKLHLYKAFTPADTVINTFLTFSSPAVKRTWVDVWGDTGKTFCAKATLYHNGVAGNSTGFVCIDNQVHNTYLLGANGTDTCYVQFITSSSEFNSKPRLIVNINDKATDSVGISIKGTDGTIDMWDEYYYYGFPYHYSSEFSNLGQAGAVTGNTITTVSDMGAAASVLLVGAYASKVNYADVNGNNWSYSGYVAAGNLVPFSSRGPMIDGRIKPDITAPGLTIATSISSYDTSLTPTGSNSSSVVCQFTHPLTNKKYYFSEFSGTSASSPAAAGIVALMLQADPTLTPAQVKNILFATAIKDNFTGALPTQGNNNWGHGKINAYGALKMMTQQTGVYQFSGARQLDVLLFPNPNKGTFTLDYLSNAADKVQVEVTNLTGKIVYNTSWSVAGGLNRQSFHVADVATGIYIVRVVAADAVATIRMSIN